MKYRITSETKVVGNITLHRIECVTAFGDVGCGAKGGWIESEKNLSQCGNAGVGENAIVSGEAMVGGNATIDGEATVGGNATIDGEATVDGHARIGENAWVGRNAWVGGNAVVSENAWVGGNARIYGDATVYGHAVVGNNAWVDGNARIYGHAVVGEKADYIVFKNWWSSGRYFTWTRSNNKWKVGCFYGSGEELIKKAYNDSEKSGREYERVVNYVNDILKEEDNGNRNKREG